MPTTLDKRGGKVKLPSDEKAMVDEIRRRDSQPPGRRSRDSRAVAERRLRNVSGGERIARGQTRPGAVRDSKPANSWRRRKEAAYLRRIRRGCSSFEDRRAKAARGGTPAGVREDGVQAARFPRWQFDPHGNVLRWFGGRAQILDQDDRLDPWGKTLFFLQEKSSLGGRRPLDLLRAGKLKEVCLAAHEYAE